MNVKAAQARFRKFVNDHHLACIVVALVLVGISIAAVMMQFRDRSNSLAPKSFYYDLSNGTVFVADLTEPPPIPVPGAPTSSAAEAFVFSCTSCADEASRFVGYVMFYEPQARKTILDLAAQNAANGRDAVAALQFAIEQGQNDIVIQHGQMIGRPDESGKNKQLFYPADSAEGVAIKASPDSRCPKGQSAKFCTPADVKR